jgi:hypothetical protein
MVLFHFVGKLITKYPPASIGLAGVIVNVAVPIVLTIFGEKVTVQAALLKIYLLEHHNQTHQNNTCSFISLSRHH